MQTEQHDRQRHHSPRDTHHHSGRGSWPRFALHYGEMVVAMLVGMAVFGFAIRAAVALAGVEYGMTTHPELVTLEMAADMTVAMVLWMRLRGHAWPATLEMAAAMALPAVLLVPLFRLGLIGTGALMTIEHVAMFALMLAAMLRRRGEYGAPTR